jgi:hypothetical protein
MSFLTPLFLIALLAAAIPIAIHLIRRDKPRRIPFSTLRFLRQTPREHFLVQKIQQWLLLLLRTLALVLLALAFARPFLSQSTSHWADLAPRSVAILLDTSMSMGYRDYLERAKTAARQILADLNPGDEASVIIFSDLTQAVHGPTSDFALLRRAIDAIDAPDFQATRYFPAIRLADELLANSRFDDKTVYLISDFQSTGMTGFDKGWKLNPGIDFITENIGAPGRKNLAITGVKSRQDKLLVQLRAFGGKPRDKAEVVVGIDGQEQWRKVIPLQNQPETVVEVPLTVAGEGSHAGRVSVADKSFALDNDFYFTVDIPPKIPVLVINGEASNQWHDDEAYLFGLAAGGDKQSPFAITTTAQAAFDPENLGEHRVAVLLNVGQLTAGQAQALQAFVEKGGNVLIVPGDRVQADSFNHHLSAISPATLAERRELASGDYLLIASMETRHPMLRTFTEDWRARFNGIWVLKPTESAEVLMTFDDGAAALVERQVGQGRSLLFASSLDLEWNNLPLQGLYLPFVHETLKYLAGTAAKKTAYEVGEKVPIQHGGAGVNLIDPTGKSLALQEGDDSFTLREPGIYQQVSHKQTQYYAVNRATEESNLTSLSPTVIVDQIVNLETQSTQSAAVQSQLLKMELEEPQRLWWWLLLTVTVLLLLESFIASRTHR